MTVRPSPPKWQTVVLFFSGLAGMGYETLAVNTPNFTLVGAFLGMMGLGPVLSRSSAKGKNDNDDADADA